jgi:hypothetical protein
MDKAGHFQHISTLFDEAVQNSPPASETEQVIETKIFASM